MLDAQPQETIQPNTELASETNLRKRGQTVSSGAWRFRVEPAAKVAEREKAWHISAFEVDWSASHLAHRIATPDTSESTNASLAPTKHYVIEDEDILIDEPLPCLPTKVQTIEGTLRFSGRGKPTLRAYAELSRYED
jgi:hypothetical protein